MNIQLQPEFGDKLQPLGTDAAEFFLAASLYYAKKTSFASAAQMAGLSFESFKTRLLEYFDQGYIMDDESVLEDMKTVHDLSE